MDASRYKLVIIFNNLDRFVSNSKTLETKKNAGLSNFEKIKKRFTFINLKSSSSVLL